MDHFRSIKLNARRDLHQMMRVPVYVFSKLRKIPRFVHARVHRKENALGNLLGTSFGYSERREEEPKLIFEVSEYEGREGDIVAVDSSEVYRLNNDEPTYNITKTWYAVGLTEDQRSLYAGPGERNYLMIEAGLPPFDCEVAVAPAPPVFPFADFDATAASPSTGELDGDLPTTDLDIEAV